MKRRLLCVLLAVMLIMSMPFAAFASEDGDNSVGDGDASGDVIVDGGGSEDGGDVGGGEDGNIPDSGGSDPDGGSEDTPDLPEVTIEPVKITGISGNQTVSVGETASFTVRATGDDLSYSWKLKLTGSSYSEVGSSSSYSLNIDSDKYDGAQIYCTVYNSVSSEDSKVLSITVKDDAETITISQHPQSQAVDNGAEFSLTTSAKSNKGDVTYAWYYRKVGETTWRLLSESSAKTNELKMTADLSLDGAVFRCKITGVDGEVFTNEATITISSKIKIVEQPASKVEVLEGESLNLVVTANGKNLSYYWYYKDEGASDWTSTGVRNNSITIDEVAATMNGRMYRCKVYGDDGEVYTNEITISVLPPAPKIKTQSDVKQFVTVGDTLKLFVEAEGEDLKYEWEYMSIDSTKWVSTGVKRREFSEEIVDMFYDGAQFRCKVTNESGETFSQIITVTVTEAPIEPCEDDSHVFTLWNKVSPSTESISGLAERTCEICGYIESRSIPAGTAAEVDLELLFSGGIVDPGEEDDVETNTGAGIDWAMMAIAAMVVCAAGIIIILVLKKKGDASGFFDDEEDDESDDDNDGHVEGGDVALSDTNEFVVPVETEYIEDTSEAVSEYDAEGEEQMTKVIPDISEFENVTEISEESETDVLAEVEECETVTNVIPVSEIEKMLSESKNGPSSEE